MSRSAPAMPGEHLARRSRRPALFETDVVLRGDVREDRDLLAAQPRRPPPRARGQADVLRPEPLAPAAQERAELLLVHTPSMRAGWRRILVQPVPASGPGRDRRWCHDDTTAPIGLLAGKVVLITGASRGIGEAAAQALRPRGRRRRARRPRHRRPRRASSPRSAPTAASPTPSPWTSPTARASVPPSTGSRSCTDGSTAPSTTARSIQQPGPLDTTSDDDIDEQFAVNFRAHWTAMTAEAALMRRQRRRRDREHLEHRQPPREPRAARVRRHEARAQQPHRERRRDVGTGGHPGQRHHPWRHRDGDDRRVGGGDPRRHRADQRDEPRSGAWPSPARSPRWRPGCSATGRRW